MLHRARALTSPLVPAERTQVNITTASHISISKYPMFSQKPILKIDAKLLTENKIENSLSHELIGRNNKKLS